MLELILSAFPLSVTPIPIPVEVNFGIVEIPVLGELINPVKFPVTFPCKSPRTVVTFNVPVVNDPVTLRLPPTSRLLEILALPKTSNFFEGTVNPIPSEPPIPVKVIKRSLLRPLCQKKLPSTLLAFAALR